MESKSRPIIKIPLTTTDKVVEIITILLLLIFWFFIVSNYKHLPETIPTHFDGSGKIDGYGEKWTILIAPCISVIFYISLSYLSRYPYKFNYMTEITEVNAEKLYTIAVRMLRYLKLFLIIIFFAIEFKTIQNTYNPSDLGGGFMFFIMSLIFIPIFYFLIQFSKNS